MPYTVEEHIDNLTRHIERVRENTIVLGKKLIARGEVTFGVNLIANGFIHDASKFFGLEWDVLHSGPDAPRNLVDLAVRQHTASNPHHPEYWDGIDNMPRIYVAEMICDWSARAAETGGSVRDYLRTKAMGRYQIKPDSEILKLINGFMDLLLESSFVK